MSRHVRIAACTWSCCLNLFWSQEPFAHKFSLHSTLEDSRPPNLIPERRRGSMVAIILYILLYLFTMHCFSYKLLEIQMLITCLPATFITCATSPWWWWWVETWQVCSCSQPVKLSRSHFDLHHKYNINTWCLWFYN